MFKDIACLHKGVGDCDEHQGQCAVKQVDVFICATSCRDFFEGKPQETAAWTIFSPTHW